MKREKILKIMSLRNSLLDADVSIFIVTKDHQTYEITFNTTYFNNKIWDEEWQINAEDVEYFEMA